MEYVLIVPKQSKKMDIGKWGKGSLHLIKWNTGKFLLQMKFVLGLFIIFSPLSTWEWNLS